MHKKFSLTLVLTVFFGLACIAQQTHEVERGETLYSVSKKYGVSISDLVKANPDANRGLRNGMSIVIPIIHESIDTVMYSMHKVRPLESFYSIKNKFGISEEVLLEFNPELSEGFRAGTFIKIPQFDEPDVSEEIPLEDEIKEEDLIEDLKSRKKKFKKKEVYNIAYLLPLYYDKNDTLEAYKNFNEGSDIYKKTHYALDFYAGAKIAIDSLNRAGMAMNIHVFDTKNNPNETFDLVTGSDFDDMDVVIGPFYSKNFKLAAEILSRRGVPIIAPLATKGNLLENIPNAFQVIPTEKRQLNYLSEYIAEHYSDKNITVVRRDVEDEEKNSSWMTSSLVLDSIVNYREIVVQSAVIDSIHHELDSMAETNVVLVPSDEKDFVTDLLTKLNATRDSNIVVFGMPKWNGFKEVDYTYLMNLNVHMPNSGLISYQDSLTQYFVSQYHEITNSEPSARFAFSGFDVTYYFLSLLYENGGLAADMYLEPMDLLGAKFDYNYNRNEKNGARNQAVQIIKYEDYNVIRVD